MPGFLRHVSLMHILKKEMKYGNFFLPFQCEFDDVIEIPNPGLQQRNRIITFA